MFEDLDEREAAWAAADAAIAAGSTILAETDEPFAVDNVGGVVLLLVHSLIIFFFLSVYPL